MQFHEGLNLEGAAGWLISPSKKLGAKEHQNPQHHWAVARPEANNSHLQIDGWKIILFFSDAIFLEVLLLMAEIRLTS